MTQELSSLLTKALIMMSEASQIEHALLKQDEMDRNKMQLITKGKQQLKIPEPGRKGLSLDLLNLSVKGNLVSARSLGGRYGKEDPSGPTVQSGSGSARLRISNFRG